MSLKKKNAKTLFYDYILFYFLTISLKELNIPWIYWFLFYFSCW